MNPAIAPSHPDSVGIEGAPSDEEPIQSETGIVARMQRAEESPISMGAIRRHLQRRPLSNRVTRTE
jgi:hypothetical protein